MIELLLLALLCAPVPTVSSEEEEEDCEDFDSQDDQDEKAVETAENVEYVSDVLDGPDLLSGVEAKQKRQEAKDFYSMDGIPSGTATPNSGKSGLAAEEEQVNTG